MRILLPAFCFALIFAFTGCQTDAAEGAKSPPLAENATFEVYRDSAIEMHVPAGLIPYRGPLLTQYVSPVDTGTRIFLYRNDRACYENLGAFEDSLTRYRLVPASRNKESAHHEDPEIRCQRVIISSLEPSYAFAVLRNLNFPTQSAVYTTGGIPGGKYTHLALFQTDRFYYSVAYLSDLRNDPTWEEMLRSIQESS